MTGTMEKSDRKAWAILTGRKALSYIPYVLDILIIIGCAAMINIGFDGFNKYGAEMRELVDAGTIPESVYQFPIAITTMTFGMILLLT